MVELKTNLLVPNVLVHGWYRSHVVLIGPKHFHVKRGGGRGSCN